MLIILIPDLLQDWRDLALLLTRHMLESSAPPPPASITGRSRSSEEEEQFVHTLQRELQRLTLSLQSIMAQGATRSTSVGVATKGNAYRSLEETQEIVDLLKVRESPFWEVEEYYALSVCFRRFSEV